MCTVFSHSFHVNLLYCSVCIDRLMNTNQGGTQQVDIDTLFKEWKVVDWKETTPDFIKTKSSCVTSETMTIRVAPLQLMSLVLQLKKSN